MYPFSILHTCSSHKRPFLRERRILRKHKAHGVSFLPATLTCVSVAYHNLNNYITIQHGIICTDCIDSEALEYHFRCYVSTAGKRYYYLFYIFARFLKSPFQYLLIVLVALQRCAISIYYNFVLPRRTRIPF